MAKRSVKAVTPAYVAEIFPEEDDGLTPAEREERARRNRAERLAPYRAAHEQQNNQDDTIAQLFYELTLIELGMI